MTKIYPFIRNTVLHKKRRPQRSELLLLDKIKCLMKGVISMSGKRIIAMN